MEQIQMVQVEHLHPHEKNPRIDAASVTDLVESIREHGIEVPLVAAMHPSGVGHVVLAGHRRLTAALQVGLAEVPVQIRDDLTEVGEQLAFMATENMHRDQLTVVEESRLVQDMLDLGMTQAEVAKQTALGKKRISERVKLSKLAEQAGDKVHRGQITVDDALVIAEYTDDPEIAQELEASAGTYDFDYKVSKARRRREDRERAEASRKLAKKNGLRLADAVVLLSELVAAGVWETPTLEAAAGTMDDDAEWAELLEIEHKTCPGHSATILSEARFISGRGIVAAGTLIIGCDQHETAHPVDDESATGTAAEAAADPWDEISADDFATAKIHRERHLAEALPQLDVADEATTILADAIIKQCWREYGDDDSAIALIEALTGHEGKSRVRRKLQTWPTPLLVWLNHHWWDISTHHRYQSEGRQGSSYWARKGQLRQLLERTGYAWTPAEQTAILLATGKAHDATTDDAEDGAALAEGGESA